MSGNNIKIDVQAYRAMVDIIKLDEDIIRRTAKTIKKWNMIILNEAIKDVNVDRGQLQTSLTENILSMGQKIIGRVGTNKFYAPYVHGVWVQGKGWVGPRPHFVPFKVAPDLIKWAKRKGYAEEIDGELYKKNKDGEMVKITGIFMKGKANPFIGNAFDKYRDKIIEDLTNINDEIR